MKKRFNTIFLYGLSLLCGLLTCVPLFAQEGDPFAPATSGFLKFFSALLALAKTLMVIGGLFSLGTMCVRIVKGEKEGAKHMLVWVLGLSVGFIFLLVLSIVVERAAKI